MSWNINFQKQQPICSSEIKSENWNAKKFIKRILDKKGKSTRSLFVFACLAANAYKLIPKNIENYCY